MAHKLAIELLELDERAADGEGDAVEIETDTVRHAVDLHLTVTEVEGEPLEVYIETSPDGTNGWRRIGTFPPVSAAAKLRGSFDGCDAYVRAGWVVTDDCTFSVAGFAHTLFAERDDLDDALPDDVLEQAKEGVIVRGLIKASSHVAHRVGGAHPLPLTEWSPAMTEATACFAAAYVLKKHVLQGGGVEVSVSDARAEALAWLKELQTGAVKQSDTAPAQELGARVVSGNPDEPDEFRGRMSDDWADFG